MEDNETKYVLGIEGSANKVGVGTSQTIQASSISKEIYFPTPGKPLSHHQEQAFYPEKPQNTTLNK